jgi:hypothetical protein
MNDLISYRSGLQSSAPFIEGTTNQDLPGSISRDHSQIGANWERRVIIEGLLTEVVSIAVQHPLNPFYLVVKDEFQFRPLNFTQK